MTVKKDAKAIGYFITLTLVVYILSVTFFIYPTPNPSLTIRLIIEISGFALMYIVARIFSMATFSKLVVLRRILMD